MFRLDADDVYPFFGPDQSRWRTTEMTVAVSLALKGPGLKASEGGGPLFTVMVLGSRVQNRQWLEQGYSFREEAIIPVKSLRNRRRFALRHAIRHSDIGMPL